MTNKGAVQPVDKASAEYYVVSTGAWDLLSVFYACVHFELRKLVQSAQCNNNLAL